MEYFYDRLVDHLYERLVGHFYDRLGDHLRYFYNRTRTRTFEKSNPYFYYISTQFSTIFLLNFFI